MTMLPRSEPRSTGAAPHQEFSNAPEDAAKGTTNPGTHSDITIAVRTKSNRPTKMLLSKVARKFSVCSSTLS